MCVFQSYIKVGGKSIATVLYWNKYCFSIVIAGIYDTRDMVTIQICHYPTPVSVITAILITSTCYYGKINNQYMSLRQY